MSLRAELTPSSIDYFTMAETKKRSPYIYRFSVGWCFAAALGHIAGTVAIAGISFLVGMGSFTQDVSLELYFWRGVAWAWTPLAMSRWNPNDYRTFDEMVGLALVWSCCIGIAAGFVIPFFKRLRNEQP
jgi:hypothetical protein